MCLFIASAELILRHLSFPELLINRAVAGKCPATASQTSTLCYLSLLSSELLVPRSAHSSSLIITIQPAQVADELVVLLLLLSRADAGSPAPCCTVLPEMLLFRCTKV